MTDNMGKKLISYLKIKHNKLTIAKIIILIAL